MRIFLCTGFLVLSFLLLSPPAIRTLAAADQPAEFGLKPPDADQDSIEDAEELWLAANFAPVYEFDEEEHNIITNHSPISEGPDVYYVYQVTPGYACDKSTKSVKPKSPSDYTLLTIVALYPYDYVPFDPKIKGLGEKDIFAHYGDDEKIQICMLKYYSEPKNWSGMHGKVYTRVESKKKIWYQPEMIFVNRHYGAPVMNSGSELKWESSSSTHFRLYVSEGKHAAYASTGECASAVDGYWGTEKLAWNEDCAGGVVLKPALLQTAATNVGEGKKPLIIKFPNAFGNGRTEYVWGKSQNFCGGYNVFSPNREHDVITIDLWVKKLGYTAEYCAAPLGGKWLGDPQQYTISVETSDKGSAGTSANVYLDIYGDLGEARYIFLDDPDKNDFERGRKDSFVVKMPSLGSIRSVCIYHDDTGDGSGWHLRKVAVGTSSFPFDQWLATDEAPGSLWACRPGKNWPSGVWLPTDY